MKTLQTLLLFLSLLTTSAHMLGQSDFVNYKAVVKDNQGAVMANTPVRVQFQILRGAAQTLFYTEEHTTATDANGIIILNIGDGTPIFQQYNRVNWGTDDHFLNVQIDTGSGYVNMGTTEFRAVPYANYARESGNVNGLEALDEGGGIGWRLIGKDENRFAVIGLGATDLSDQNPSVTDGGAQGNYSLSTGFGTRAVGNYAVATGLFSEALGIGSFTAGTTTVATGIGATAVGSATRADSFLTSVFGAYNVGGGTPDNWVDEDPLFEIGNGTSDSNRQNALTLYKDGSLEVGFNTSASGTYAIAMGEDNSSTGYAATTLGFGAFASGEASLAVGTGVNAGGEQAFAIGRGGIAFGDYSAAFGINTRAQGDGSIATGNNTRALGDFSIAGGLNSQALGLRTVALGEDNIALGTNSLALGINSQTELAAENSLAVGLAAHTHAINSVAFGNAANARAPVSFAFGGIATTRGIYSMAAGLGVETNSAREIVLGSFNQTYNASSTTDWVSTDRLLIVGNGSNSTNRSNAMVILKNGNVGFGTNNPQEGLHINNGRLRIGTETIEDDGNNRLAFNAAVIPDTDDMFNLGNSSNRWNAVWAVDGTINTSDRRAKTNIEPIAYGLNEVLAMNPVQFQWKERPERGEKLGLIAQELLELVPEVVKTHEFEATDENGSLEKKLLERYGVYYTDLIPILIKAMQEQQKQIDTQKQRIQELTAAKEQLSGLMDRIDALEASIKADKL